MSKSAEQLAREYAPEAIKVIAEEMNNPLNEAKDRIRAAESLLERGHGKPTQAIIAIPAGKRALEAASGMTDSDLLEVMRGEALPRLSAPTPVDAEFTEVELEIDPLLL